MTTSDVIIVGGGCVGVSVAYHLAELGCSDVVLLEAGELGCGSTSKAAGGIRTQHADPLNTRLARRSLDEFLNFFDRTGTEIDFKQVGYLFLLSEPADVELFTAAGATQRELGIPVETLTVDAVREIVPQLATDDLLGGTFCPIDGYATPEGVVQGYAAAARRRGVRVRQGVSATAILSENGRVTGVQAGADRHEAPVVVCAAGVGSTNLAATAGVRLPVVGEPRRIFYTSKSGGLRDGVPLTVDFATGFYFHREGPGLVFAGREFDAEDLMEPATHRLPVLSDLPITSSWHGDYDTSPDHNALIGAADEVAGLFYATGFSGHGFMLSPAVGEHVAELIVRKPPTIELGELNARRFTVANGGRAERMVI